MLKPKSENVQKPDVRVIPLKDCLAKTIRLESGNKPGVSVETHCRIVGYVARELMSRLPAWLRGSLFPKGSELIAAAHDVGKVSPTFQEKIHRDIEKKDHGIGNPELDKVIGYHSAVSQATLNFCQKYIPEILDRAGCVVDATGRHGAPSRSLTCRRVFSSACVCRFCRSVHENCVAQVEYIRTRNPCPRTARAK